MKIITNKSACLPIPKPIPPDWENLRRQVASQAGRHAIIAGGAIRDHILGLPVRDIDIFVLGMSALSAKEIFGADIIEYAGVEEAKHQYRSQNGLTVNLVFSRYNNAYEVLEHFDLGICRAGRDGWDYVVTDDFEFDRRNLTITTFYPSPSGHQDRVLAKLRPIGFKLAETVQKRAIDFSKGDLHYKKTAKHRKNDKPRFDRFPYDNYTVGISVAAREVTERVHRLANPQYPDLTAREVVIDAATKDYYNEGMPPWPISRAGFTCGDVLMVLEFDLTNQTLACWLASEEEDGKTPILMVDEADWKFGDDESWSRGSRPSECGVPTLH